eukprot:1183129-Prorocentrum_minimum.AAC.3
MLAILSQLITGGREYLCQKLLSVRCTSRRKLTDDYALLVDQSHGDGEKLFAHLREVIAACMPLERRVIVSCPSAALPKKPCVQASWALRPSPLTPVLNPTSSPDSTGTGSGRGEYKRCLERSVVVCSGARYKLARATAGSGQTSNIRVDAGQGTRVVRVSSPVPSNTTCSGKRLVSPRHVTRCRAIRTIQVQTHL